MKAFFELPFIQVALPIMLTMAAAVFYQNKRLDDLRGEMRRGFDEIIKRLDRIEDNQRDHEGRIIRLETKSWK